MKLRGWLVLALVAVLGACAAGGSGAETVARDFLTKLKNLDFKGAAELATEEGKQMLTMMDGLMAMAPAEELQAQKDEASKQELKIVSVTEEAEGATVTYTIGDEAEAQTLNMVKVDGAWKADFQKAL